MRLPETEERLQAGRIDPDSAVRLTIKAKLHLDETLLVIALFLITSRGCGEPESPRFVPASGVAPAASTADRSPDGKASREVVIPKNIPMH